MGDFRDKGYQADALFNYLALLGWSPGNDVEYMNRDELVTAFTLDRVLSSSAQMDHRKLLDFNGRYLADLPAAEFATTAWELAAHYDWSTGVERGYFDAVAALLQTRTKLYTDIAGWEPYFIDAIAYDEKAQRKFLSKPDNQAALAALADRLAELADFAPGSIEAAVHATTEAAEIKQGKLNQPIRVALTGQTMGAGIYETAALLGRDRCLHRLRQVAAS